jgi:hypothetical protein
MTDFVDLLLQRRPAWPRCKVAGCANDAALGGACAELHGGAAPTRTPGGYVLFMHWPEPGEDSLDPERWEPLAPDEWQCWCVSRAVWDRWAVDGAWPPTPEAAPGCAYCHPAVPRFATRGGLGAPQPLRPRAARTLLREGRVSLVALQDQLEAGNRFLPGLAAVPELLRTALVLLRLSWPLTAEQLSDCHQALAAQLQRIDVSVPPIMPELEPFAREPEPPPWRPMGWGRPRRGPLKPPSGRFNLRLDAYSQHPEWPLPEALIDSDAEDRMIERIMIERIDRERRARQRRPC